MSWLILKNGFLAWEKQAKCSVKLVVGNGIIIVVRCVWKSEEIKHKTWWLLMATLCFYLYLVELQKEEKPILAIIDTMWFNVLSVPWTDYPISLVTKQGMMMGWQSTVLMWAKVHIHIANRCELSGDRTVIICVAIEVNDQC